MKSITKQHERDKFLERPTWKKYAVHSNHKQLEECKRLQKRLKQATRNKTINMAFHLANKFLDLKEKSIDNIIKEMEEFEINKFYDLP